MRVKKLFIGALLILGIFTYSVPVSAGEGDWKALYIDYVKQYKEKLSYIGIDEIVEPKFKLVYIDEDNIPELYINGTSTASGDELCTYYNGKISTLHLYNYGLSYIEKRNLLCDSGGRMDVYYDNIYKIENGEFIRLYKGDYGAKYNSDIQWDEVNNKPIYEYYWNGKEVSEEDYNKMLNSVFNKNSAKEAYNATVGLEDIILQISKVESRTNTKLTKPISVILNGRSLNFNVKPYIEKGTTMVPMRAIFEALGANVDYDKYTKKITAQKGDTVIELAAGSNSAVINGKLHTLSVLVANRNGSTMIPLRFVSEALGADVGWNADTKTVTIEY